MDIGSQESQAGSDSRVTIDPAQLLAFIEVESPGTTLVSP
jgi:hypothetical protein